MNRDMLLLLSALALASPLAFAHEPAGTPKNHCENPSGWSVHDYGPPATGLVVVAKRIYVHADEWASAATTDDPGPTWYLGPTIPGPWDGNLLDDCNGDTIPADYDGHKEFALGGAILCVDSGDGVTTGCVVCHAEAGHHPFLGPITVRDVVFGTTVPFYVGSDTVSLIPPTDPAEPDCGDGFIDNGEWYAGTGTVSFPPGVDGAYIVFVGDIFADLPGTLGHVRSP